jgi:hypothetical protein
VCNRVCVYVRTESKLYIRPRNLGVRMSACIGVNAYVWVCGTVFLLTALYAL